MTVNHTEHGQHNSAMPEASSEWPAFVTPNEPLAPYTTYEVGGPARWLAQPRTVGELANLVTRCGRAEVRLHVLGRGANLLVCDDGVDGMVVRLNGPEFRRVNWGEPGDDGEVLVTAGAGADLGRVALDAVRRGLSGLEWMAGIPGTLGGAVRMNAGGRFGQIGDVVREVSVLASDGSERTLSGAQVGFRYRGTNLGDAIVCRVTLGLRPDRPEAVRNRFMEVWDSKKRSQPLAEATAGCVFKNPPGCSAGELIDRAGLKNRRIGGAQVSDRHANFIVAQEGAKASDVLELIALVRREVAARFGVELELEIEIWGQRDRGL